MPYYSVFNDSVDDYSSVSLDLLAGETTVLNVPSVPIDLNAAVVSLQLVITRLGVGAYVPGGDVDVVTDIIETSLAASLASQELVIAQTSRLPPGVEIENKTPGDIAIRISDLAASFVPGSYDEILSPGEILTVAADYLGEIQAICEIAEGTILIRAYS